MTDARAVIANQPCAENMRIGESAADAIIAALAEAGLVIAPRVPTEGMIKVATLTHQQIPPYLIWSIYVSLLEAANEQ